MLPPGSTLLTGWMTQQATGIHGSWAAVGLSLCITSSSNDASSSSSSRSQSPGMPCLGEVVSGQPRPCRLQVLVLQGQGHLLLV